jgi:hypothetical protein
MLNVTVKKEIINQMGQLDYEQCEKVYLIGGFFKFQDPNGGAIT